MKKNYIIPQMAMTSVCHMAALCTGSETVTTPTVINADGTTSDHAITTGD